jgi:hypothetical protein
VPPDSRLPTQSPRRIRPAMSEADRSSGPPLFAVLTPISLSQIGTCVHGHSRTRPCRFTSNCFYLVFRLQIQTSAISPPLQPRRFPAILSSPGVQGRTLSLASQTGKIINLSVLMVKGAPFAQIVETETTLCNSPFSNPRAHNSHSSSSSSSSGSPGSAAWSSTSPSCSASSAARKR